MSYLCEGDERANGPGGPAPRLGGFGWIVRSPASPEGHEVLTRRAIPGGVVHFTVGGRPMRRVLSPAEIDVIVEGNRNVDWGWHGTGLLFSFSKGEQKRHALRREYGQPQAAALADITGGLRAQHTGILAERVLHRILYKIGQILHLIQDSFSPAHVERRPGSRWCMVYIRNFGRGRAPREHGKPRDPRDEPARSGAEAAQAVDMTRRYLQIVFKALYGRDRGDPVASREAAAEFARFTAEVFARC